MSDAILSGPADLAEDRSANALISVKLLRSPRLRTGTGVDRLNADRVPIRIVGRPAGVRTASSVPTHANSDKTNSAVSLEDDLCQRTRKVRASVLDNLPVVNSTACGVVADNPSDIKEISVASVKPAVVLDHREAPSPKLVCKPNGIAYPCHKNSNQKSWYLPKDSNLNFPVQSRASCH